MIKVPDLDVPDFDFDVTIKIEGVIVADNIEAAKSYLRAIFDGETNIQLLHADGLSEMEHAFFGTAEVVGEVEVFEPR
jgi:hypothetical protein